MSHNNLHGGSGLSHLSDLASKHREGDIGVRIRADHDAYVHINLTPDEAERNELHDQYDHMRAR